jgi:ABC-2 type transport system ATP-binding protein
MPGKFGNQQQLVNKATHSIGSAPPTAESVPAPHPVTLSPGHPPPLLLFDRVSKWYGPVIGVNQVTLELRPGITGLVGANGSGKSTLLRLATGQLRPDLGSVRVRGLDVWDAAAKRHVGYCPDNDSFYEEMSGRQFVRAMARLCGFSRRQADERTDAVLELVGMTGRAERRLRGYSKGMRQRIKLAQALVHDPALLVLDEPLSGIDPVGRAE